LAEAIDRWSEPLRPERTTTEPVVRIVLAEAALAPGPLHYLLESEGFQVLGSASDDEELTRLLTQSTKPEVIVVDAAVPVASVMVAREFSPASELIVIWPEGVVPPPSADQVFPELVYEDLGPAVNRAAHRNRLRRPVVPEPEDVARETESVPIRAEVPNVAARRTAARVLVGTVALIASIIVTMGVSFALEGWRASHVTIPARPPSVTSPSSAVGGSAPTGRIGAPQPSGTTKAGCDANRVSGPNAHAANQAQQRANGCPAQAGGGKGAAHGPTKGTGKGSGSGAGSGGGGSGHGHGQGSGHGSGQGSGQGSGHGSSGTNGPGDHPTGPPSTPPGSAHAPKG
jgi:hypothetical protein